MSSIHKYFQLYGVLFVCVLIYLLLMLMVSSCYRSSPLLQIVSNYSVLNLAYRKHPGEFGKVNTPLILVHQKALRKILPSRESCFNLSKIIVGPDFQENEYHCTHPTLSQQCYTYDKLSAHNKCCKLHSYDKFHQEKIFECAKKSVIWHQAKHRRTTSFMHWMLIGDSHIRYMYEVLVNRLQRPMLLYRMTTFRENDWKPMGNMSLAKYKGIPVTVQHRVAPLMITYVWSAFLRLVPNLTDDLLAKPDSAPTLILMGTALHWMKENEEIYKVNPERAAEIYKNYLMFLSPALQRLASTSLVVFKLLDHLPESKTNVSNIDLYNSIASEVMPENVAIWDSIIPLSDSYVEECKRKPRNTPLTKLWMCKDGKHSGFIIIEKYIDMLLNYGCNRYLNLDESYCL